MATNEGIIKETENILNILCRELGMAESANDPFPIDGEYKDYILELGGGYLYRDYDGWKYNIPRIDKCKAILDNYYGELR
jgi:hypothetical protein